MTIGKRLIALLAVPLVGLLALGIMARVQLSTIEERSRFVAESQLASVAVLGNIARQFAEVRVNLRSFLLATDQRHRAAAREGFEEDDRTLTRLLQHVLARIPPLKVGHLGKGLLDAVKEVQDGLPPLGQLHLGVQVGVDAEIVAQ